MSLVQTFLPISAALLVLTVAYGAMYIDSRFTLLLLPPLMVFYFGDDRNLPEGVAERFRNPKPLTKVLLVISGLYWGFKITGLDLQEVLGQDNKPNGNEL
mmetsp:Transcript_14548/g.20555  ORF Transcript_14548/g.20555 Transcript_14548/m.20555 type:complete len:100 (-) Transcript_14548:118-417(-)